MSVKILLNGYKGRMGAMIAACAGGCGCEIFAKTDAGDDAEAFIANADAVIDFSFRDATAPLAKLCVKYNKPLVIGTTGHSAAQKAEILESAKLIPIVWAGNYSLGVNVLNYLTRIAARALGGAFDVEIVEMHHRHKKDAPSGTADKLIEIILKERELGRQNLKFGREGLTGERPANEIGVHALRGGSVVGDHTVIFASEGERLELTHKAEDRKIFANGALSAAKWLVGRPGGLYGMEDVLGLK